ncbi:MAG: biotin/lipoyl-binding protein, partial [Tardiphaga sp.]
MSSIVVAANPLRLNVASAASSRFVVRSSGAVASSFTFGTTKAGVRELTVSLRFPFFAVGGVAGLMLWVPACLSHERLSERHPGTVALDFDKGNSQVSDTKPESFPFINGDVFRIGGGRAPFVITDMCMISPIARPASLCAVLLLAASVAGCGQPAAPPKAAATPEVGVLTLRAQNAPISTVLPGRTSAYQVAEVRPQVSGILLERKFVEGAEVKAGDLLYEIDPVSYKAALESAEAALLKVQAALVSVKLRADRKITLLKTNAASQQEVDDAVATLKSGEADVKAAE